MFVLKLSGVQNLLMKDGLIDSFNNNHSANLILLINNPSRVL